MENTDIYEFFKTAKGHVKYNETCKHCTYDCKQSFRVEIVKCPKFVKKTYERKNNDSN